MMHLLARYAKEICFNSPIGEYQQTNDIYDMSRWFPQDKYLHMIEGAINDGLTIKQIKIVLMGVIKQKEELLSSTKLSNQEAVETLS